MWIGREESLRFESCEWCDVPPCDFAVLVVVVFVGAVVVDSTRIANRSTQITFLFCIRTDSFCVAVHVASGQSTPYMF